MKNMYKANRQRLTDIPYAHNPTDVNKNLFSLKTFQQQKHAAKTWKKYAVEKTATAKIRNIALKYFKKNMLQFQKKHDRLRTKYKTKDKNTLNIFSLKT